MSRGRTHDDAALCARCLQDEDEEKEQDRQQRYPSNDTRKNAK